MAFKSIKKFENDRYGKFLRLDDGKSVTGVFLYKDYDDVLIADAHYINSNKYSGYVHCCEDGCPACKKGLKPRNKLFIPFLVIADLNEGYYEDTVIFWDRNINFMHQLRRDVFDKYPEPEKIVFKITRHGAFRDINTTYSITPKMNFVADIDDALADLGVKFPDYYESVIRSVDAAELNDWLNDNAQSSDSSYSPSANYSYQAKPRKRMPDPEDLDAKEAVEGTDEDDLPGVPVKPEPVQSDDDLPAYVPGGDEDSKATELPEFGKIAADADAEDEDDFEPTF